jgi:glycosyltransferase involved in cell wall biosynthesis
MCANKDKRPLGSLRGGMLRNWYQRFAYPKIFVSEQARGEFTHYYPDSGSSYAIPNGVIHGQVASPERWRDGYGTDFTVGFSGRLNFQKDPLLLAQAWLLVRQSLPQCRLVIAGDGEMRPAVESLLRANAPEGGWEILGWLEDPAQLQAAYTRFDLMILASLFESAVPLVLMETATQGIPTVALSIPQYQEFRSLLPMMELVEGRSPQLLAEAIVREYHQQRLLKAVTPTVLTTIRDYFSVSRMARLTIEAYQDAIAKSCGSAFESKACPSLD